MQLPFQNIAFDELVARPDRQIRLAEAALLFARDHCAQLQIEPYLGRLDALARRVDQPGAQTAAERLQALRRVLVEEENFRGNDDDYYNPKNSFLHEVLETRRGLPIALSVIWLDVAEQLGWPLRGVNMPGRYIVQYQSGDDIIRLDPYDRGRELSLDDCESLIRAIYKQPVNLMHSALAVSTKKQTLTRMLNNLSAIFSEQQNYVALGYTLARLLALNPKDDQLKSNLAWVIQAMTSFN